MVMPLVLSELIDWFDPNLRPDIKYDPYFLSVLYGVLSIISGVIVQPRLVLNFSRHK